MAVKMVIFDIDGVLTDGRVYVDQEGKESKAYSLTEIDALNDIINQGYLVAAITGEDTPIIDVFRKKIRWNEFVSGCKNKLDAIHRMEQRYTLVKDEICYIGDGKYDIDPIKYVGFGVCPENAIKNVKIIADQVLEGKGGTDCIQELLELLQEKKK